MKKKIEYCGIHMPKGEYEVRPAVAEELLKQDGWKEVGDKLDLKDKFHAMYGVTYEEFDAMSLKELRAFAKKWDFKSKDTSADELQQELWAEFVAL